MTVINSNKSLFFKSVISSTLVLPCDASSGCSEGLEFLASLRLVEISRSKPSEMSSPLSSVSWTQPSELVKPVGQTSISQYPRRYIRIVTLHLVTHRLKNLIFSHIVVADNNGTWHSCDFLVSLPLAINCLR